MIFVLSVIVGCFFLAIEVIGNARKKPNVNISFHEPRYYNPHEDEHDEMSGFILMMSEKGKLQKIGTWERLDI